MFGYFGIELKIIRPVGVGSYSFYTVSLYINIYFLSEGDFLGNVDTILRIIFHSSVSLVKAYYMRFLVTDFR